MTALELADGRSGSCAGSTTTSGRRVKVLAEARLADVLGAVREGHDVRVGEPVPA